MENLSLYFKFILQNMMNYPNDKLISIHINQHHLLIRMELLALFSKILLNGLNIQGLMMKDFNLF